MCPGSICNAAIRISIVLFSQSAFCLNLYRTIFGPRGIRGCRRFADARKLSVRLPMFSAPVASVRELFLELSFGVTTITTIVNNIYSRLALSRFRLSRIFAYLEVKTWSLLKYENQTTGKKYCGKEEKLLLRSSFSLFPQYFQHISNFRSQITYWDVVVRLFFLNSANLIRQGRAILKYFRESLGLQDGESPLYVRVACKDMKLILCWRYSFCPV